MNCGKCGGKVFVDRTFTENKNYEVFCILCGKRTFVSKHSQFGQWLHGKETLRLWGF